MCFLDGFKGCLHVIIFVSMKYGKGIPSIVLLQKAGQREMKRLVQCHCPSSVAKNLHWKSLVTPRLLSVLLFKPHFIKSCTYK